MPLDTSSSNFQAYSAPFPVAQRYSPFEFHKAFEQKEGQRFLEKRPESLKKVGPIEIPSASPRPKRQKEYVRFKDKVITQPQANKPEAASVQTAIWVGDGKLDENHPFVYQPDKKVEKRQVGKLKVLSYKSSFDDETTEETNPTTISLVASKELPDRTKVQSLPNKPAKGRVSHSYPPIPFLRHPPQPTPIPVQPTRQPGLPFPFNKIPALTFISGEEKETSELIEEQLNFDISKEISEEKEEDSDAEPSINIFEAVGTPKPKRQARFNQQKSKRRISVSSHF